VVDGNKVVDLTPRLKYPDLKALIAADGRSEAERAAKGATADFHAPTNRVRSVIPNPDKIICIGLNYTEHREETGMGKGHTYPTIFPRWADTQVGSSQPMIRPRDSDNFDTKASSSPSSAKAGVTSRKPTR